MGYSARYSLFVGDKRNFFASIDSATPTAKIYTMAHDRSYTFLAANRFLLEEEFNQLYGIMSNKQDHREEFWLYCYYCCVMLQRFYSKYGYNKPELATKYRKLGNKIAYRCENKRFPDEVDEDTFLKKLGKKIGADLDSLASTPKHTTKIRDWLGFVNIHRLVFVFSRLSVKRALLLANELFLFEKLNKYFGTHLNVNRMISIINAPTPVFNVLSVGLFAARFFLSLGLLMKHTFAPTHGERTLSATQRFYQELYKRHGMMLNDIAWATINLLCNYSAYFGTTAIANELTLGFLLFDVALLVYRRQLEEHNYCVKKSQYLSDKKYYEEQLALAIRDQQVDLQKQYLAHCQMLDAELLQLNQNWTATNSTYLFNVAAAAVLLCGFSAALLLTGPAGIAVSFIVCTIAVAMYLSADKYGKLKGSSLALHQCQLEASDKETLAGARKEFLTARNNFILALFKNTFMPMLLVTTFAVCWPAALVLTALYVGYGCTSSYFNGPVVNKKPPLSLMFKESKGLSAKEDENNNQALLKLAPAPA